MIIRSAPFLTLPPMTTIEKELLEFAAAADVRKSRDRDKMQLHCVLLRLEKEHGEQHMDLVRLAMVHALEDEARVESA